MRPSKCADFQSHDEATYGLFVLRTKAGEVLRRPSRERVDQLIKSGQVPEWFVSRDWLEREYARRPEAGERAERGKTASSAGELPDEGWLRQLREEAEKRHAKVIEQYERQIEELKADKEALRQEKREALASAQQDKQMFADAVRRLTQFLSQPAIVQAVQAQLDQSPDRPQATQPPTKSKPPAAEPAENSGRSKAPAAAAKTARGAWWGRLWKSANPRKGRP